MARNVNLASLREKLFRTILLAGFAVVVVAAAVLLVFLYYRDREQLISQARERAVLIRTGLLSTMISTGDAASIREAVDSYKKHIPFDFRMVRSEFVQHQFGNRSGETPRDRIEEEMLEGKRAEYSSFGGTTFRFIIPFVTDARCGKCHQDLTGNPLGAGKVNGLAEFIFDITETRNQSVSLALGMVAYLVLTMAIAGTLFYFFLDRSVMTPMKNVADAIGKIGQEQETEIALPPPKSREMSVLMEQVKKMGKAIAERRREQERMIEEERNKMEQIRAFAFKQAKSLGIVDQDDISAIFQRLSSAVRAVEKSELLTKALEFVTLERKELVLHNDISLVRPAALYLTDLMAGKRGSMNKGAMELALEEAVLNAIIHGNLEVESKLKEVDFSIFDNTVRERAGTEPYRSRKVHIRYQFSGTSATVWIADEGKGFDWQPYLTGSEPEDVLPHGRGLMIIRAFASTVHFADQGREIIITFDLEKVSASA